MSQLFISHSSRDNFAAKALADWLAAEGFSEIFLDLWYDLGSDQELGAAFISPTDVANSAYWKWKDSFPVLSLTQLRELARDNLSPHCRPADPAGFRSSKCWPAYLE